MGGGLVRLIFGADRARWWTYPEVLSVLVAPRSIIYRSPSAQAAVTNLVDFCHGIGSIGTEIRAVESLHLHISI
jgi:hypothetical protein